MGGDPNLVTGMMLQVVGMMLHLKHVLSMLVKFDHFPKGEN